MILDFKKLNENISKILESEELAILEAKRKCEEIINQNTRITEEVKKEIDENHGFSFKVGSFTKSIFIRDYGKGIELHEVLNYEKNTRKQSFEIQFFGNDNEITGLLIQAGKNKTDFVIEILNTNDFYINSVGLYKKDIDKNIYLIRSDEKSNLYLNLIKKEDLTNIDNKEYEDLFSLVFDYKLNLKEHSSFEVFKKEFNFFLNNINKESKNKLRNKI